MDLGTPLHKGVLGRLRVHIRRRHQPKLNLPRNFSLVPEGSALPCETTRKSIVGGVLQVLGAMFSAAIGLIMFFLPRFLGMPLARGAVVFVALCTSVQFIVSIRLWVWIARWRFTETAVSISFWCLKGKLAWSEPLSAYDGLLRRNRQELRLRGNTSVYELALKHRLDEQKSFLLARTESVAEFRQMQKHYAQVFGLPVLIADAEGITTILPEDLNRSVAERVAKGSLPVYFADYVPPRGLIVKVSGGTMRIADRRRRLAIGSGALGLALLLLGTLLIFFSLVAAPVFLAGGLLCVLAPMLFREELEVSREHLAAWRRLFAWKLKYQKVDADRITDVVVKKQDLPGDLAPAAVNIFTNAKTIIFGRRLKKASKKWVRDCIIAVISKAPDESR